MPMSFKIVGAGVLVFLVGLFMSLTSLKLAIWGKKTKAEIMDATAYVNKVTNEHGAINIAYRFTDDKGESVRGGTMVPADFVPSEDMKLDIVYLPGKSDVNQLASKSGWTGFLITCAGIGITAFGVWYFNNETIQEAHAETARDLENARKPRIVRKLGL